MGASSTALYFSHVRMDIGITGIHIIKKSRPCDRDLKL